jgi:hypothetical protein
MPSLVAAIPPLYEPSPLPRTLFCARRGSLGGLCAASGAADLGPDPPLGIGAGQHRARLAVGPVLVLLRKVPRPCLHQLPQPAGDERGSHPAGRGFPGHRPLATRICPCARTTDPLVRRCTPRQRHMAGKQRSHRHPHHGPASLQGRTGVEPMRGRVRNRPEEASFQGGRVSRAMTLAPGC